MKRYRAFLTLIILVGLIAASPAQAAGKLANKTRALVLGGGGPVGGAWETALVGALADKGVDLSRADLIIGTSAGSMVGAQLAMGRTPAELLESEVRRIEAPRPSAAPAPDLAPLAAMINRLVAGKDPPEQMHAKIGAWALKAHPIIPEDIFVGLFERLLPANSWTTTPFECTAVDTADGAFKVWDKTSGVSLADAVASSCAVPGVFAPVEIKGHRYMDGGTRSSTNADLAKGYSVVVIVDVTARPQTTDLSKRYDAVLQSELKILKDSGSRVVLITPDAASLKAFGPNLMDPNHRGAALAAGLDEGHAEVERLKPIWNQ